MEKLYRIEELTTNGWHLVEMTDVKLTKQQATERLNGYLAEGYNPNRLRAVVDTPSTTN
jgi:hypothetical protein